jgi:hypothetical protein
MRRSPPAAPKAKTAHNTYYPVENKRLHTIHAKYYFITKMETDRKKENGLNQ